MQKSKRTWKMGLFDILSLLVSKVEVDQILIWTLQKLLVLLNIVHTGSYTKYIAWFKNYTLYLDWNWLNRVVYCLHQIE